VGACGGAVEREQQHAGATSQALTSRVLSACSASLQQDSPVISGSRIAWTEFSQWTTPTGSGSSFDVVLYDLGTGTATNQTNTQMEQEFLQQISGDTLVWTHTSNVIAGDLVVEDLARQRSYVIGSSDVFVHFEQPAIDGNVITFLRVTSDHEDVYFYDNFLGTGSLVTNDTEVHGRPRTDGSFIVFEDYASFDDENAHKGKIMVQAVGTFVLPEGTGHALSGTPFAITDSSAASESPDVDGGIVVYTGHLGTVDQIFLYDTVTATTTQLTSGPGHKIQPRISGGRVVWSDDRAGDLDVYGYDIATKTEVALATGTGDQFIPDIEGDQVVFTNNATGCERVELLTFPVINPPPTVASAANDVEGFFASGDIKNHGIENALLSKLAAAAAERSSGDCAGAAAIYQAFINSVEAQRGKGISDAAATALVADAQYLMTHCP
jgi:beta propeller repeat protein